MGSYHLELAKGIDEVKFVGSYDIKESRQQLAKEKASGYMTAWKISWLMTQ